MFWSSVFLATLGFLPASSFIFVYQVVESAIFIAMDLNASKIMMVSSLTLTMCFVSGLIATRKLRPGRSCGAVRMTQVSTISVANLYHAYGTGEGRRDVLKDVRLEVAAGEMVILSGPSGSGKTTLLTLLGALRTPQRGQIRVLGQDLTTCSPERSLILRRRIGFIFQQHNLLEFLEPLRKTS